MLKNYLDIQLYLHESAQRSENPMELAAKIGIKAKSKAGDTPVIGVLYESDEWSDYKLAYEIASAFKNVFQSAKYEVRMIDMQDQDSIDKALTCDVLVSRVFASALNRGHDFALKNMDELLKMLEGPNESGVILVNEARAHRFEISKYASTNALRDIGISVPEIYQSGQLNDSFVFDLGFPCVLKPDCGGRTTDTDIVCNQRQAEDFCKAHLAQMPYRVFLAQEYIEPVRGFITRVEIVGGKVALAVKRSVAENGLSAYRFGSVYKIYDDVSTKIVADAEAAAAALGFTFGSFDIIETNRGNFFIDANSVSNVSEDCTEIFGMDLMREHAKEIARIVKDRCK